MNNKDRVILLGTAIFATVLFGVIWLTESDSDIQELINQCESQLPRTEHCVLVAVPVEQVAE